MNTLPGKETGTSPAVKPRKAPSSPTWPRPPVLAARPPTRRRRPKLSHVLFACLLLSGIIPLAISSWVQGRGSSSSVRSQKQDENYKVASGMALPLEIHLQRTTDILQTLGQTVVGIGGTGILSGLDNNEAVLSLLRTTRAQNPHLSLLKILGSECSGPVDSQPVAEELVLKDELQAVCRTSRKSPTLTLVRAVDPAEARILFAVPIFPPSVESQDVPAILTVVAAAPAATLPNVLGDSASEEAVQLMLDFSGGLFWWNRPAPNAKDSSYREAVKEAILQMDDFAVRGTRLPFAKEPQELAVDGETMHFETLAAPIFSNDQFGAWFVVARPSAAAAAVDRLFYNTLLSSVLLVLLSLLFAAAVARWLGRPLDELATTTREVAAGNFAYRVDAQGLTLEMVDVAENFNRMSEHVERYVQQLREAATANRELFIGSIRAFAAAIDAKDPYTRGHSERVAAVSRAVARHLGYDDEFQQRVWLGALLHDVGKIGVDDRILKKGGLLSPPEFEQMKLHTVIGAEIMGRIDSLKEIIPAIRWHHEAWNGKGYPDCLKGEQIPLIARIVAVADTFDAVTTSRPYQQAYTPEFAVATITRLASTRFDAKVVTAFLSAFNAGQIESAVQRTPSKAEDAEVSIELLA